MVERRWFNQIEYLLSTLSEMYLVEYSQTGNLAPVFKALKSTDYKVVANESPRTMLQRKASSCYLAEPSHKWLQYSCSTPWTTELELGTGLEAVPA
ncbi:jg17125 [Pararge aegeria aegeria]|uniref:Jg17125 protein n=1 Tax=Pararge aegeria aegeria TaxID=348720 RepID=A0A8S4SHM1_9NEOP|nr:jg17125 [Pararge aegeria aegeria]